MTPLTPDDRKKKGQRFIKTQNQPSDPLLMLFTLDLNKK